MGPESNDPSSAPPTGPTATTALHAFGLDEPDDCWLARLRAAESADPLTRLGGFDVLSEVGRGGQGVVYRARERETRRTVALKRLLGGSSAGSHSRRRLERELETAASLDHGGIVNMLGLHLADGQPVLAMEWIDGVPITQWAAGSPTLRVGSPGSESRGTTKDPIQIIDIALEICAALQHAHQRGVMHRDLKPSNILVDADGHPHLLDFGLAKFAAPPHSPTPALPSPAGVGATPQPSALTIGDQFLGTLGYASPEQLGCRGDVIDVRSDLYQFGLILYELLTGRMPYPVASTPAEALALRERWDPPRPSSINRKIDRDLDAIVFKAMALEPADRYQSIDALSVDLAHHRAGEPIVARGPGTGYLLRKLLRRHRFAVAFIATVMVLVVIGGTAATVLAVRLASSQAQERQARDDAEQMNAFLRDMLASADPARSSDVELSAHEWLDRAGQKLEQQFADRPQLKASLHETIGRAYLGLGLYEPADTHLQSAVALSEGGNGSALAAGLSALGELRYAQRRYPEAEQFSRRALGLLENRNIPDQAAIACELNNLGAIRRAQGDLDQAETLLRQALAIRRRLPPPPDHAVEIAETLNNLANVLRLRKDYKSAEAMAREVLAIRTARLGPRHPLLAQSLDNLGVVIASQGRRDEAQQYFRQGLAMYRECLGTDHPDVGVSAGNFGSMLVGAQRYDAAEPLLRDALRIREAKFPTVDQRTSSLRILHANCLLKLNRPAEAEPLLMQELKRYEGAAEATLPNDLVVVLIDFYERTGKADEAERYRARLKNRQKKVEG